MRFSPGTSFSATQIVSAAEARRKVRITQCLSKRSYCFLWCCAALLFGSNRLCAQDATRPAPPATAATQPSAELASHDEPATFKVNVKLVVVRAVVRDSKGNAVGTLHKEDFEIFDKGKPQVITQFEVEQPGDLTAKARQNSEENANDGIPGEPPSSSPASTPAIPERFVAYLFDDVHLEFGDLARVREAAEHHFSTLRPTDRAAIFTTSGQTILDFTDDQAKLHEALLRLQPRPISGSFLRDCPEISYYQADLIVNKDDANALQVAIEEQTQCGPLFAVQHGPPIPLGNATAIVKSMSQGILTAGQHAAHVSLSSLEDVVRSLSRMPGQRSLVMVSPGFITPDLQYEYTGIIDRAVRAQVVINSMDARGLYVIVPYGDASQQHTAIPGDSTLTPTAPNASKTLIQTAAASAQAELLATLADGTGGVFFHNNNDFDEGFRRAAQAPDYSYVLAFSPQNLKLDGSFHTLKIALKGPQKLTLQARRGYYAPKNLTNPDEQAKQEIEDAMYSQEEFHNLPIKLRTQYFKESDSDAKLVVLAHVDVQKLHFRKIEGRNDNVLTCVSAVFNRNGNFLQGTQKVVTMHWKDETLEHKLASGITLKTSFDVKPGSYLVRLVVRDEQGRSMSAENGSVEIR
jgi:VWFA-related protein